MSNQRLDLSGRSFGALQGCELLEVLQPEGSVWLFGCDCGDVAVYRGAYVATGRLQRCRGCYLKALRKGRAPRAARVRLARPLSLTKLHPREASSWKAMKARTSSANKAYIENYGARGIGLDHKPWLLFENFLRDMGERPAGLSLERENNELGYSPANCCWATPKTQLSNTRVAHRLRVAGESLTATEVARRVGVTVSAVCNRIKKNGQAHTELWAQLRMEASNGN